MRTALFLFAFSLYAAPPSAFHVDGITPTQVLYSFTAPSTAACTTEASYDANFATLHPDTPRYVYGSGMAGRRQKVLGRRRLNYALKADTVLYIRETCSGESATVVAQTRLAYNLFAEAPPAGDAAGSYGFPSMNWSDRTKCLVDPQTGVEACPVSWPTDDSSAPAADEVFESGIYFGASGWTNPERISNGVTGPPLMASTSNTNAIYIPIHGQTANRALSSGYLNLGARGSWAYDVGLHLYGSGSDATASNRYVGVALCQGITACGTETTITLPTTAAAQAIAYGSNSVPTPMFAGWGGHPGKEFVGSSWGKATVAAGVVTITRQSVDAPIGTNFWSAESYAHPEWPVGTPVYFAGSSPTCALNYCRIASVQDRNHFTLQETGLTLGSNTDYTVTPLTFRIRKLSAVAGSISVSASWTLRKGRPALTLNSGHCSPVAVSTTVTAAGAALGRTVVGYPCAFPQNSSDTGTNTGLWFVGATENEFRFVAGLKIPTTISGHAAADLPNYGYQQAKVYWDTNGNMFAGVPLTLGGFSVFSLTYTGDYRSVAAGIMGHEGGFVDQTDANVTWNNLQKASTGNDARTQILAGCPSYDESKYGNLSGLVFDGVGGTSFLFHRLIDSQNLASWLFFFSTSNGAFQRCVFTLTGEGLIEPAAMRFAGSHASVPLLGRYANVDNNLAYAGAYFYGGPFRSSVTHVKKSGSWSTNTSLPTASDGSYDADCPVDMPAELIARGATGTNCVQLRIANQPCSSYATTLEKALTPCPGDPTKSYIGSNLRVMDGFANARASGLDQEHFTIGKLASCGGTCLEITALRDAAPTYCCAANRPRDRGIQCLGSDANSVHADGWALVMSSEKACTTLDYYIGADGSVAPGNNFHIRGHGDFVVNTDGTININAVSALTAYTALYRGAASESGTRNRIISMYPGGGSELNTVVQSYSAAGGAAATGADQGAVSDRRIPAGGYGVAIEAPGQLLGNTYTLTPEGGTTNVYKVSGISLGTVNMYTRPLVAWAGRYHIRDISSPALANTITDATPFTLCKVLLNAGECRSGSSVGDLFVSVPGLETAIYNSLGVLQTPQCHHGQATYRTLCIFSGAPIFGQVMQLRIDQNDPDGLNQTRLGWGFAPPAFQYPYSKAMISPDGKSILWSAHNIDNVWTPILRAKTIVQRDSGTHNTFIPIKVTAGANSFVEFGYEEHGSITDFYCTARSEKCRVKASSFDPSQPFMFAGEPGSATPTGATISIPGIPGRMLFYRVCTSASACGDVIARAVN
jgi:hypothetical protein